MECLSASLQPPPCDVDLINSTNLIFFHLSENWISFKRKEFIKTKQKSINGMFISLSSPSTT